jgi:hypothetical protein
METEDDLLISSDEHVQMESLIPDLATEMTTRKISRRTLISQAAMAGIGTSVFTTAGVLSNSYSADCQSPGDPATRYQVTFLPPRVDA